MSFRDLRGWMEQAEKLGQLETARGASWNLEIGTITELVFRQKNRPAVLFDDITDYKGAGRVLINSLGSNDRMALTWGLPAGLSTRELKAKLSEKYKNLVPIKPMVVADGPVMENVITGDAVDLFKFPTPLWHEDDGGRYIGTGSVDITMDPDENWVNLGCYRVMIMDKNHAGFYISPGKHGRIHRTKYLSQNQPVPLAISCGHDPLIFLLGAMEFPYGISEYEWAGAILGQPMEVIKGPLTGLPIPASAELVLEGFVVPGETRMEGPFGEWTGYYASDTRPEPVIEVKAIYHRNNPIILGSPPSKPPNEHSLFRSMFRSILIEDEMAKAGIPDVTGVWCHEAGGSRLFNVVAIKQRYPGHAKQAAMVATFCHAASYLGRYTVVVDDDIDITDINEVIWAMSTRVDPVKDIDIIDGCLSGPLDPIIPVADKGHSSRAIINACRPIQWIDSFPKVVGASPKLVEETVAKWKKLIYGG
ncbi:MAG: UbiD family decarboxylase [Dehalococcoidia bacterium]|nr:UbiD family decarboxylase [Dehalococcoidia bacterium]